MENVHRLDRDRANERDRGNEPAAVEERALAREQPHSDEAEMSVLGTCIMHPAEIPNICDDVEGADFYRPANQAIFDTLVSMAARGNHIDPLHLIEVLTKAGELQRVGGEARIWQISDWSFPGGRHAEIVRDRAVLRELIRTGINIARAGYDETTDTAQALEAARDAVAGLATVGTGKASHLTESLLEWGEFFATDFSTVELLPGRIMAPGQQITLIGDGKAGKSLFMQDWAWRMATGQTFLGDAPQRPIPVLYLDAENGRDVVQERLVSFGAGPGSMGLLRYASFPPIRPLDTPGGGTDLIALAQNAGAELVVIDTVSRFISGPENDADTWLALYRNTLLQLKRNGIGSVRLDHFGKDKERGGRGSSAKTQDVDHVWELSAQGGGVVALKRTHTRTGIGPDAFVLHRHARREGDRWMPGGTRHELAAYEHIEQNIPGSVEDIITKLDVAQVPSDFGRPRLADECRARGIQASNTTLAEVARRRKARGQVPDQNRGQFSGQFQDSSDLRNSRQDSFPEQPEGHSALPATHDAPANADTLSQNVAEKLSPDLSWASNGRTVPKIRTVAAETPGQTCPGQLQDSSEQHVARPVPLSLPPREGQVEDSQDSPAARKPHQNPICDICGNKLDPNLHAAGHTHHILCTTQPA